MDAQLPGQPLGSGRVSINEQITSGTWPATCTVAAQALPACRKHSDIVSCVQLNGLAATCIAIWMVMVNLQDPSFLAVVD